MLRAVQQHLPRETATKQQRSWRTLSNIVQCCNRHPARWLQSLAIKQAPKGSFTHLAYIACTVVSSCRSKFPDLRKGLTDHRARGANLPVAVVAVAFSQKHKVIFPGRSSYGSRWLSVLRCCSTLQPLARPLGTVHLHKVPGSIRPSAKPSKV